MQKVNRCKFKPESFKVLNIIILFLVIASEALVTNCKKCTEKQKEHLNAITEWFAQNEPENWNRIVAKSLEDLKKKNASQ